MWSNLLEVFIKNELNYSFYMKILKIIIMFFIIFFSARYSFGNENTVWDIKNQDFWTELEDNELKFEKEKNTKLDAQIELDLNAQNYEIDLIDAINTGIQNSSSYKIAKYQKEYSDWEFANKLSEFLPNINYSFTMKDMKGEFLVGGIVPQKVHETIYSSTFSTNIDILNGQRIFDTIRLRNQQKEKKHTQNYTKEELIYKISNAYYELLQKKIEIEIYRYNLVEVQEQLKYNQALYDVGNGTRFDILRSESELEAANADLENAILGLKTAQTKLANIAGYPIFSNLQPKDKIIHKLELIEEDKTPDVLYAQAVMTREDLKAKENSIKALKAKRNSAFGELIPTVTFNWDSAFVGTFSTSGKNNDTFGFTIAAPLGKNLGVNSFTKYKMDEKNYLIAQTELEKMKSDILKNITDNYFSAKVNNEIIEAKNKQIISTNEGLRQAVARMRIGEATYLDVTEANKQKTLARIELISAIISYNKSQLSQLFETGNMNLMEIKSGYERAKSMFKKD